jgi:hypothetical protein
MNSTAVLYCIREEDSPNLYANFIDALVTFPALKSDLFILAKSNNIGFAEDMNKLLLQNQISGKVIRMSNEGFDIGTYRKFILASHYRCYILMSASSKPAQFDWVKKLDSPILDNSSMLVGSMCSWESLSSGILQSRVLILRQIFEDHNVGSGRMIQFLNKYSKNRFLLNTNVKELLKKSSFFQYCLAIILLFYNLRKTLRILFSFPFFPNPHLRTTGMAITREFFLEMSQREFKSKIDALSLESGFKSFTRVAMSKNGNPLIYIEANYVSPNNSLSTTSFRSEVKLTPPVVDAHYERYSDLSIELRKQFMKLTWGKT